MDIVFLTFYANTFYTKSFYAKQFHAEQFYAKQYYAKQFYAKSFKIILCKFYGEYVEFCAEFFAISVKRSVG